MMYFAQDIIPHGGQPLISAARQMVYSRATARTICNTPVMSTRLNVPKLSRYFVFMRIANFITESAAYDRLSNDSANIDLVAKRLS